jgi:hypothetical protein
MFLTFLAVAHRTECSTSVGRQSAKRFRGCGKPKRDNSAKGGMSENDLQSPSFRIKSAENFRRQG